MTVVPMDITSLFKYRLIFTERRVETAHWGDNQKVLVSETSDALRRSKVVVSYFPR
jgi:hypothetical protein